jgi:ABC-type branched-subunit amino acid transport system ATPase component
MAEASLGDLPVVTAPEYAGPLLAFRDVSVRFGGIAALTDLTFEAEAGDVLGVVGPNGAGKSTMLNAVSGLLGNHATGDIAFAGKSILGRSAVTVARAGIGRSFQDPPLITQETVLQNVLVGQHLRLRYSAADQVWRRRKVARLEGEAVQRAINVLDFMGIADLSGHVVGNLSYGTKKLIDIARAVAASPRLLLLDEPTSGLDAEEQLEVSRILTELHRTSEITVVIVEHHLDVVRTVANKVIGLQAGMVLASGTPKEVLDSEQFQAAIIGDQPDSGEGNGAPLKQAEQE